MVRNKRVPATANQVLYISDELSKLGKQLSDVCDFDYPTLTYGQAEVVKKRIGTMRRKLLVIKSDGVDDVDSERIKSMRTILSNIQAKLRGDGNND